MHKILIIKQYDETVNFWETLEKRTIDQSLLVSEILKKYRGFEGKLLWLGFSQSEFQDWIDLEKKDPELRFLYVLSVNDGNKPSSFSFMGSVKRIARCIHRY